MTNLGLGHPAAIARVSGGPGVPGLSGTVAFFRVPLGVIVAAEIRGLPHRGAPCSAGVFGFHIHEGTACTGADFADTKGHYNPGQCPHPQHAGDLPPLFECQGRAFLVVLTDRFEIPNIIGRTVVIHSMPDDFTSQPAGNAGTKIGCGVIRPA